MGARLEHIGCVTDCWRACRVRGAVPCADLFAAMAVSRAWRDAAQANYVQRAVTVPPSPDALLHAVARARAGDTLRLLPGEHHLSAELAIEKPLRISAIQPSAPPAAAVPTAATTAVAGSSTVPRCSSDVVLVAALHVLLRTRCATLFSDVTFCRMGDHVGYPNTVLYAEAGTLRLQRCRVTCGGSAPSVLHALQHAFAHAPAAGTLWEPARPGVRAEIGAPTAAIAADATERGPVPPPAQDQGTHCPQAGVWVGAGAVAEVKGCIIACCMGPGIKVHRGRLLAKGNTIAFSTRGANVVANGGQVVLERNEIVGANGDGIASWNDCRLVAMHNSIHENDSFGVVINTDASLASVEDSNVVWSNGEGQTLFRGQRSARSR